MVRVIFGGQVFSQAVNVCLYWARTKDFMNTELSLCNPGYVPENTLLKYCPNILWQKNWWTDCKLAGVEIVNFNWPVVNCQISHSFVLPNDILFYPTMHYSIRQCIILSHNALFYSTMHYFIPQCIILSQNALFYPTMHYSIPQCIILSHNATPLLW